MTIQYRGKAGNELDRAFYSPQRDIAYIGPDLIRASLAALDEQWQEPWFKEYWAQQGLTEEQLGEAAKLLGAACNRMMDDANPVLALEAVGFDKQPGAVQMAIYTKMGQVLLAAIWAGVKDVGTAGSDPPERVQAILATAQLVLEHFAGRREQHATEETNS